MRSTYTAGAVLLFFLMVFLPMGIDAEAELDPSGLEYFERIVIEGDLALESNVLIEGWPGNGTSADPYLIEGYILESTWQGVGFYLGYTTKHLIIRDCIIKDDGNVSFSNSLANAYIIDSSNITFTNCMFISGSLQGLRFDRSANCTITNCSFDIGYHDTGFTLEGCSDMSIEKNLFEGPISVGISIGNCRRLSIFDNVFETIGYGFNIDGLADSTIARNKLLNTYNANLVGVNLENVTISDNMFERSEYVSVWLYWVDVCRFERNEFTRTTFGLMGYMVHNSTFIDNSLDCGYISIALESFENITFSGNRMWNSSIHLLGEFEDFEDLKILPDNEVNDLPLLFVRDLDMKGKEVEGDVGIIILVNVSNAVISDRTMQNTFSPINLIGCEDVTVSDCKLIENSGVLYALNCNRLKVENIKAEGHENGIHMVKVTNSTIAGNQISSSFRPLDITSSSFNSIVDNDLSSFHSDTKVRYSDDNVFRSNFFSGNLRFSFSYRNEVEENKIRGNLVIPDNLLWDPDQPEPRNNIINGYRQDYILNRIEEDIQLPQGSEELIFFNITRCGIPEYEIKDGKGVTIIECSDLIFREWTLDSCQWGFDVRRTFRVDVIDSEIIGSGGRSGISLLESTSSRIEGNHIEKCGSGIFLDNSVGTEIFQNVIFDMDSNGITIYNQTREFLIVRNEINGSIAVGILVSRSRDGLISGNVLIKNGGHGIYFTDSSERNLVYNNHFIENRGSKDTYRDLNRQAYDVGMENEWYYKSPGITIGNYWADMQGPDDDNDGIVDIEYYMDGYQGSYDLYPMIEDYEPEEEIAGMRVGELWLTIILTIAVIGIIMLVVWRGLVHKFE